MDCEMKFFKFTLINNVIVEAEELSQPQFSETLLISWDDPNKRYFCTVVNPTLAQNRNLLLKNGQKQYNDYLKRPYPVALRQSAPQAG